ncbi:MAG: hypothetical protein AAF270_16335 [Pseudomonadota bacterium]
MTEKRISVSLYFLLQAALLVAGAYRVLVHGPTLVTLLALLVVCVILLGLFRPNAEWARNAGFVAGAGQLVLGLLAAGSGLLDLLRFNTIGLVGIAIGALLTGLGLWTMAVMNTMSGEHERTAT